MKCLEKYIEKIENIETLTQLPKKKNYTNRNLKKKSECKISKKINAKELMEYCLKTDYNAKEILISTFVLVLSKYVNNKKIIFSLLDEFSFPFYKDITEEETNDLFENIRKILDEFNDEKVCKKLNNSIKFIEKIIFAYNKKITRQYFNILKRNNNELELVFNILVKENNINLVCLFDNEKINRKLIENFIEAYYQTLKFIINEKYIKNVCYLTSYDIKQYEKINNTNILINEKNIPSLFEQQVMKNQNKLAVVSSNEKLTYNELNSLSNKLANLLIKKGIKSENIVTIILNRSVYSSVARQGILKAGGAFLNIIPDYPIERINYILEDCNSKFIITTKEIIEERKDVFSNLNNKTVITIDEIVKCSNETSPKRRIKSNQLCYCIYTSGSTGKPKGVMIEQRNLLNYCKSNKYNAEANLIVKNIKASLALASLTFDVSILEEFIPLLNGGTMVIANEEEIFNPIKLASLIKNNNVEAITCTPSFLNNIIDIDDVSKSLKHIKKFNIGAESFIPILYKKIKKINSKAKIYNGYGPTEATIGSTIKKLKNDKDITIGLPMANIKTYITNSDLELLPIGVPGELVISGNGVGRGYINNLKMTEEKFVNYMNQRAYKSGDLAYINFDGEIEFISRIDNQIKINGFRIELSEIENVIGSYQYVDRVFVKVIESNEEKFIGAYLKTKEKIDINELNEYLKEHLPYYMIPKFLLQIDEFPINNNGKIDSKQLPIPNLSKNEKYVEASNDFQKKLCYIFQEILKKDKVGITDNFFELGGKSLGVMKLIALASKQNIKIAYKDIFDYPTIEKLDEYLNENKTKTISKKESDESKKYSKIHDTIKYNSLNYINELVRNNNVNNIVISGVTGYLGMHVLNEYLTNYKGKIYCFIRKGNFETIQSKFEDIFKYYFDIIPDNLYERLTLIEGDITDVDSLQQLEKYKIDTFINCAALVKYFDSKNLIEKTNVGGVKNIISYCKKNKVRLIQISTTSIGGTRKIDSNILPFKENILFFGQGLENKYSKTKFLAEQEIISEIPFGLDAKIIRIGNLMPRYSDYKFQINYLDNGFLSMFKAFKHLGMVPEGLLGERIELSPVDGIAKTIFLLANTNDKFNVYHSFNNNNIHYYDLIHAMTECGFNIKTVSNDCFKKKLEQNIVNDSKTEMLIGLFADLTASSSEQVVETEADNTFTTEVLYKLGYSWKSIDNEYLINTFKKMAEKSYFD